MKLKSIKKACYYTDKIFYDIVNNLANFKTEKDIESHILNLIKKYGLKPSFPPIVASGKNGANPHHEPKNSKLRGFVVIDFGVRYNSYCSDMSRMLYYGKITKQEKKVFDTLLDCYKKTINNIKIGMQYKTLSLNTRKKLGKYEKNFIHSLGHGVGRKIHQNPRINIKSKDRIKKGDIIAIEPGIYIKNKFGMRIEDTIYIGNKINIITKSERKVYIYE